MIRIQVQRKEKKGEPASRRKAPLCVRCAEGSTCQGVKEEAYALALGLTQELTQKVHTWRRIFSGRNGAQQCYKSTHFLSIFLGRPAARHRIRSNLRTDSRNRPFSDEIRSEIQ